ncbi:MAG: DUF2849 domain-containing protein [Rhodospirillales bacterium]|jgi:hypothetical protein
MSDEIVDEGDDVFQVITANRLSDGHVVYLTQLDGESGWTTRAQSATVFAAGEVEKALEAAEKDVTANVIVNPYATEITGKNEPLGAKETLRSAGGPSVRFGETRVVPKDPDYTI